MNGLRAKCSELRTRRETMSAKNRYKLLELRARFKEAVKEGDILLARAIAGQLRQFVDA